MRQESPRCSFKRANSCLNVQIPIYTPQNFHQRGHDLRVHACPYRIVSAWDWDNLKHDTTRIVSAPSQCGTTQARCTSLRLSQHDTVSARNFSARYSKHGTKTRHDYSPGKIAQISLWGDSSPHISAAPHWNSLKPRSQALTNRSSLASIKVAKALHHFPQSYSHFHIPQLWRGKFTPYLNNYQGK